MNSIARAVFVLALTIGIGMPVLIQAEDDAATAPNAHAVFVMTNSANDNEVISYMRTSEGLLREFHRFRTGGRGSGGNIDPLESQGSLTLSRDGSFLLAVNAGSGDISIFRVHGPFLSLLQRIASGGSEPNAIAQQGNLVYVLNAGRSSDVVGFWFKSGHLIAIPGSVRFLSTNTSGASSLAFSPDGKFLLVTERLTNSIDVFQVLSDGKLSTAVLNPSVGPGVFSLVFAPSGTVLVSETGPAGVPNGSAASSYAIQADGTLKVISTSIPTLGAANCWNVVTPEGHFLYNSNAGSANIAGFAVNQDGSLMPLSGTVVGTNPEGATNLDIAISSDGKFLYSLNSGNGTIGIFAIEPDGHLTAIGAAAGLQAAAGLNGIAAN